MDIKISEPFENRQNYGPFLPLIDNGYVELNTNDINAATYNYYFTSLCNMLVDGCEHPVWEGQGKIKVTFTDSLYCYLTINDLYTNMILWYAVIMVNERISSQYLFFEKELTMRAVGEYLNNKIIRPKRTQYSNRYLNNVIASCTDRFGYADAVSMFLADTINFHDDILLEQKVPRYRDLLHVDMSGLALDKIKDFLASAANEAIDIIKNSKHVLGYYHSLASNFRTGEALNKKQYTETYIGLGTQADADGSIVPNIINSSFINGGLYDIIPLFMEAARARKALIISHKNVGTTGVFARLLKLLCKDVYLKADPDYICDTRNFERITITDANTLKRFDGRYYRLQPNGIEMYLDADLDHCQDLIGKTVYFRSPMTCVSAAQGHGVCYRCYGRLAYTNVDMNIGIIASSTLSRDLTQKFLSAKHILEAIIYLIIWCDYFNRFFTVDVNQIIPNSGVDLRKHKIIINAAELTSEIGEEDSITDEDEDDGVISMFGMDSDGRYYITEFIVETPSGERFVIKSKDNNKMVLSESLNDIVERRLSKDEDIEEIAVDFEDIDSPETGLFTVVIESSEITKALSDIDNLINKNSVSSSYTKDEILQTFIDKLNEAKLDLMAVHAEVILSQLIMSTRKPFARPDWRYENEPYTINAMSRQLENNPSITTSLSYQNVSRQLYNPKTFQKKTPSIMDLFFAERSQQFLQTIKTEPPVVEKDDVDLYKFVRESRANIQPKTAADLVNPFIRDY